MKHRFTIILKDNLILLICKIFLFIITLNILILFWKWKSLPLQLPLFYSLPRGYEQLATPWQLLLLPIFSIVFFLINFLLAAYVWEKEKIASYLLAISGLVQAILFFLILIKILYLIS